MKRVLILDASQRSALAVTRSLGKQGINVFTAEESPTALASSSRFSIYHFTYPSPRLDPEHFIETLSKLVKEQHIDILLPMTELTTTLLLMHQASFPSAKIPFPDMSSVDALSNKCLLMRKAESLDIPIPRTWYADSTDNLTFNLDSLPYPIALKPGKSWLYHDGQWQRAAVQFASNSLDARHILDTYWAFKAHPFMIQKCVDGYGAGIFAIYDNGKPLALFAHRRLREKPPSGGVSVLSESIKVDPELGSYAQALLGNASWHGVAMVEFKIAPDGTPYLMEINTRFWGSLQLAIDSGIDFPYMLYKLTCSEQPAPVIDYRTGIKLRWLLGDLDNLYLTLRDKQTSLREKIVSLVQFITPSPLTTHHEVNRINDIKPFFYELRQYYRDILKMKSDS